MKRYVIILLTAVLFLAILGGCAPQENPEIVSRNDLVLPVIQEHYWGLFDNHCSMIYEPGFSAMGSMTFTLLSAVPLEQTDITVTLATGWDTIYYLDPYDGKDGMCYMYEDILLLYQGVSAEELLDYQAGTISAERKEEINDWLYAYRALGDSEKPMIYRYSLEICLPIDVMDSDTVLDAFTVNVNGEARTYQLGTVLNRMWEPIEYIYDSNFNLNCDDNIGYYGFQVDVTSDGSILLDNIKYTADDDVAVTGIRFHNGEEVQIQSVTVCQSTADGAVINTVWDMEQPIELCAGDSIVLNVQIADPFFAGTLGGWNTRYLMLEYQSGDGTYELGIPFQFAQTLSDPFAYIAIEDGIDVLAYYLYYLNMLRR